MARAPAGDYDLSVTRKEYLGEVHPGVSIGAKAEFAPWSFALHAGTEESLLPPPIIPPQFLSGPNPAYTPRALNVGVVGQMVIFCVITTAGEVRDCDVLKGLPYMNEAVVAALEQRRYTPAIFEGEAIEVDFTFFLNFGGFR